MIEEEIDADEMFGKMDRQAFFPLTLHVTNVIVNASDPRTSSYGSKKFVAKSVNVGYHNVLLCNVFSIADCSLNMQLITY